MTETETVFAFTPAGSVYPPYVNLSRSAVGGWYWLTIRGEADKSGEHPMPGAAARIPLDRTQIADLIEALKNDLAG